ncbi:tape measure protein [Serpentinimonas maccroryi]|uniref:tape measure protein n=1 Tax=Serpentinimonas maccroryi TaxID=1458426 RepID=UPI002033BC3D|nr:tape measure protein [Serpentinimonas maccroryi]MCM2479208.1 tape measure protein [Serpentinimonas maccroryi]
MRNRAQLLISAIDQTRGAFQSVARGLSGMREQAGQVSASMTGLRDQATQVGDTLGRVGAALGLGLGVQQLIALADQYSTLQARLALSVTSQEEFNRANSALFEIAQRNRAPLEETVALYARLAPTFAAMGRDQSQALAATDAIGQAVALSGTSAAGAAGALTQLGQAFASGVLRGEEFNSVNEATPRVMQAIAQGMGVPIGALRQLAEQGRLTADVVLDALLSQSARLKQEYASLPLTVSGALTQLRNAFLLAIGSADQASGTTAALAQGIALLAQHLGLLINLAGVALVAALGRMIATIATSIAANRAEMAARVAQLRLLEAEAAARVRVAQAALAQAGAQGQAAVAAAAALATARTEAATAAAASASAAASTTLFGRATAVLGAGLRLLGGPIGLAVTGVALLAASLYGARNTVVEFGGRTATMGQIVVAVWDLVVGQVRAAAHWLASLVGVSDLSWGRIRTRMTDAVSAIGTGLAHTANAIIGSFNAVGSVVGVVAGFMVERFRSAFADMGALARALGSDIAAAFRGDFSLRHLRQQLQRGANEMRNLGQEIAATVQRAYGRNYVGEAAAAVARNIRPEAAGRARVFAQAQPTADPATNAGAGTASRASADGAQQLAQAQAQAQAKLLRAALERSQAELEQALADRLISIRDFHAQKTALELQGIDAEMARTRSALAEQQRLATAGADLGQQQRALGEVAKLEAELIVLGQRRSSAALNNSRAAAQAERELAEALEQVRLELAQLSGSATDADRRGAILAQYRDLRQRLLAEGDGAGVSLVDRLIDVKAAQANLQTLEANWQLSAERMRTAQQAIQLQQQAGLLSESQARSQIIDLQQQSAVEMERLLPIMQQVAQAIGPEAVQRVQALSNELAQTRLVADTVALTVDGAVKDGLVGMFEAIGSGAKSAREAFGDFARSVLAAIQRIAAQQLAESLFGSLFKSGSASSIGGFVSGLFRGAFGFAQGGLVHGPGSSTSDSIPARLSAGEYVINAAAVRRVGVAFLHGLNGLRAGPQWQGGALALAAGGLVPPAAAAPPVPAATALRIINSVDPALTHDHLQTPAGERVIVNIIGRNARSIRAALQG